MITALDHIAIAVPDLEKAIQRFVTDFGLPLGGTEDVLEAKTTAAFLPLPPTSIELVHPLNDEGLSVSRGCADAGSARSESHFYTSQEL